MKDIQAEGPGAPDAAPETGKPQAQRKIAGAGDQRPTLKTIAFMTGLGITTVSKALKDAPDIGEATKQRVKLVAKQVGYRPNRAGVRLRTGRTNVISLILDTEEEIIGLTSQMIQGISETLAGTPYHLVLTPYTRRQDPMDPVRYVVETGSADGVILSTTRADDPRVRYLDEHGMPFATHGRTQMGITHAFHDYDNEAFAGDAVSLLAGLGRKRLALIAPPAGLTYTRHMQDGFLNGLNDHSLHAVPLTSVSLQNSIQEIAEAIRKLMSGPNPPDGIVAGSAGAGIGACFGAEQAGLCLGRELDIVSKQSSFDLLTWFRPGLNVITENFREAGKDLAAKVLALIEGTPAKDLQTVVYSGRAIARTQSDHLPQPAQPSQIP
ncbi:LacI family transcriptional regulator [Roseibium litorale]|uniref:LacI family transcriptional regulator n=1 Tax=Roseibium litorale TaxID=2803841 RepID=UPI0031B59C27